MGGGEMGGGEILRGGSLPPVLYPLKRAERCLLRQPMYALQGLLKQMTLEIMLCFGAAFLRSNALFSEERWETNTGILCLEASWPCKERGQKISDRISIAKAFTFR
jgi:hypothetical protein